MSYYHTIGRRREYGQCIRLPHRNAINAPAGYSIERWLFRLAVMAAAAEWKLPLDSIRLPGPDLYRKE